MMVWVHRHCLLLVLVGVSHSILGQEGSLRGKVHRVFDGDTFTILDGDDGKEIRVRLAHVDCPESKQSYGQKAREFTNGLIYGEYVTLEILSIDRYGRLIAVVITPDKRVLNYELLAAGYAWHYRQYSNDQKAAQLEKEAQQKGRGLWQELNPVAPWDWRKANN